MPRKVEYDLCERNAVHALMRARRPHVVVHLAAVVGGVSMKVALRDQFASGIESNGHRFGALLTVLRQQVARAW